MPNAFTELNEFHKMMEENDFFDDKQESSSLIKEMTPMNPFAILSQEIDRRDSKLIEERKKLFEFENNMLYFGKKVSNKAN